MTIDDMRNLSDGLAEFRFLKTNGEYPWLRFRNPVDVAYAIGSSFGRVYFSRESRLLQYIYAYTDMTSAGYSNKNWYMYKCDKNERILDYISDRLKQERDKLIQFEVLTYKLSQKDCLTLREADMLNKLRKDLYYTRVESSVTDDRYAILKDKATCLQFQAVDGSHYLRYSLWGDRFAIGKKIEDDDYWRREAEHSIRLPNRNGKYKIVSKMGNIISREEQALCYIENKAWMFLDKLQEALKEAID